jgi:predicted esterase
MRSADQPAPLWSISATSAVPAGCARKSTSLDALAAAGSPPFFLWHTAEDPYVPPEHTYRLAQALAARGVPHVFAHGPHSLGLARGARDAAIWTTLAEAWIHEQR